MCTIYSHPVVSIKQLYTKSCSSCFLCLWGGAAAAPDIEGCLWGGRAGSADSGAISEGGCVILIACLILSEQITVLQEEVGGRHCTVMRGRCEGLCVCPFTRCPPNPSDSAPVKGQEVLCLLGSNTVGLGMCRR